MRGIQAARSTALSILTRTGRSAFRYAALPAGVRMSFSPRGPPDQPLHRVRRLVEALAIGVAARRLHEAVGVVPLRQLDHRHAQPFFEQHVEALARGLLSRLVLVEVERDLLREAAEEPRRARR